MPNANWSNPTLTSTYTNFVSEVKNRDEDLALQFDGTTSTNIPTGTIRWNSSANTWQKWSGSAWGSLTSTFALGTVTLGAGSATAATVQVGTGTTYAPGIYSPGTDQLAISTAGTERLFVNATGKVGIGTSSPTSKLDLVDTAADPVLSIRAGSTFSPTLYFEASGANAGAIKYDRASQALTFSNNSSSTERLRIDFSGRVGIGVSSPQSQLQVLDQVRISNSSQSQGSIVLGDGGSTSFNVGLARWNGGSNTAGAGGIGYFAQGTANVGGHYFYTGDAVAGSQTARMAITPAGNVGIGTTGPANVLDVVTATFGDTAPIKFTRGGGGGSPGYLYSDGSGAGIYNGGLANAGIYMVSNDRIDFRVNGNERARIDSSGRLLVGTTSTTDPALLQVNGDALVNSLNAGPLAGARNRIINGGMQIDQRNSGASISSGVGAVTYSVDRWYVYATGAAVSAQRVTSSNSAFTSALRISGAASNTGISIGQRIEAQNSYDLAGKTVTLSFYAASSASVTLNWKMYYAGAANDFTTKTQSNTGTQATTSTLTKYSATFTLSASATTGVCLEFELSALTSGSVDITGVQLELGSVSTPFEQRSFGAELELCQRYFASETCYGFGYSPAAGNFRSATSYLPVNMRVTPTVGVTSASGSNVSGETAQVQSSRNVGFFTSVLAAGAYTHDITFTATAEL